MSPGRWLCLGGACASSFEAHIQHLLPVYRQSDRSRGPVTRRVPSGLPDFGELSIVAYSTSVTLLPAIGPKPRTCHKTCSFGFTGLWGVIDRRIFNICYSFTGNRTEAEDLSQDVFLRVYRTLGSYRSAHIQHLLPVYRQSDRSRGPV